MYSSIKEERLGNMDGLSFFVRWSGDRNSVVKVKLSAEIHRIYKIIGIKLVVKTKQ